MSINISKMITYAKDELTGILYYLWLQTALLSMTLQNLYRGMVGDIVFIECLQRDHSRLPAYSWHDILEEFPAVFAS
jgi:hypothetical protein